MPTSEWGDCIRLRRLCRLKCEFGLSPGKESCRSGRMRRVMKQPLGGGNSSSLALRGVCDGQRHTTTTSGGVPIVSSRLVGQRVIGTGSMADQPSGLLSLRRYSANSACSAVNRIQVNQSTRIRRPCVEYNSSVDALTTVPSWS